MNTARIREQIRRIADHSFQTEKTDQPDYGQALTDIADLLEDLERRVVTLERKRK
jgi:hypothetical protein